MTRFRGIKGRLGRAEAAGAADTAPVPHIVFVGPEGREAALARFADAYPRRRRNHGVLVVPARSTDADDFAARFKAQQMALVREASSEPIVPVLAVFDAEQAAEQAAERRALAKARSAVAASKIAPTKLTFTASNSAFRSLHAAVRNPDDR